MFLYFYLPFLNSQLAAAVFTDVLDSHVWLKLFENNMIV